MNSNYVIRGAKTVTLSPAVVDYIGLLSLLSVITELNVPSVALIRA